MSEIEYKVEDCKGNTCVYSFSYPEMKEHYYKFKTMSDEEFMNNLPDIIHFACFVCWLKGTYEAWHACSDTGIIHELVHLLTIPLEESTTTLDTIREMFNERCLLA